MKHFKTIFFFFFEILQFLLALQVKLARDRFLLLKNINIILNLSFYCKNFAIEGKSILYFIL